MEYYGCEFNCEKFKVPDQRNSKHDTVCLEARHSEQSIISRYIARDLTYTANMKKVN